MKIGRGDGIAELVTAIDVGPNQEGEEAFLFFGLVGEYGLETGIGVASLAVQELEVVGAGFVIGEDQEDGRVIAFSGLVELKDCYFKIAVIS